MPERSYLPTAALVGIPVSYIDETLNPEEAPAAQNFNSQRAPDYIQLVRQRAQELITCIDDADSPSEQVPTEYGVEPVSQSKLKDMLQLSEDIHVNLERMSSMTRYHDDRRAAPVIVPVRQDDVGEATPSTAMPHSKRRINLMRRQHTGPGNRVCFSCNSPAPTPQWRSGPHGPKTLCNVCGLIYAKRHRPPTLDE